MPRKNFIARNDGFTCKSCAAAIGPAQGTYRNHCPHCLTSLHVDSLVPGDRASTCHGLMPIIAIEGTDPDKLDLVQMCTKCHLIRRNRTAPDDSRPKIFDIIASKTPPPMKTQK